MAAEYDYQAYGARTETVPLDQPYGFTGREHDAESGLLHYRARHFDPATGMFLQRDPIGFAGGDLNLYAYTWNDPLNWTDPSGLNASIGYRVVTAGVVGFGAREALKYLLKRCIATPGCRSAALQGLKQGVDALADALGLGEPDGSTDNPGASCGGGGLTGIFCGIVGIVDKIVQDMNDLIVRSVPNEGSGGSGGPGPGDGDGTPKDNKKQNKEFNDAVKKIENELGRKLTKDDRRDLHDWITGQNFGFWDIVREGIGLFK